MTEPEGPVGFVGLGSMGWPMASNLAGWAAGLVVWGRRADVAQSFAREVNCTVAPDIGALARACSIVVLMLSDPDAVEEVLLGTEGAAAAMAPGDLVVDMSTIGPDRTRSIAAAVAQHGIGYVDAPVSGSVDAARQRTLTAMIGGSEVDRRRAMTVVELMAGRIFEMGEVGTGSAMKLVVNTVIYGLAQAVAEGLVVAERSGLEPALAYTVLENSAAGAPMIAYRRSAYLHPSATPPAFTLPLAEKDLVLITELAASLGIEARQSSTNLAEVRAAIAAGYEAHDLAGVAEFVRRRSGPAASGS